MIDLSLNTLLLRWLPDLLLLGAAVYLVTGMLARPFLKQVSGEVLDQDPEKPAALAPLSICGRAWAPARVRVKTDSFGIVEAAVSPCCVCRRELRAGDRVRLTRSAGGMLVTGLVTGGRRPC